MHNIYQKRRQQLAKTIGAEAFAIIFAAPLCRRNGDVTYPFRQESDFYYLTGLVEEDAVLLIKGGEQEESTLFSHAQDEFTARWQGARLGQEKAIEQLGVHSAFPLNLFETKLKDILKGASTIYYAIGKKTTFDALMTSQLIASKKNARQGIASLAHFHDIEPLLGEMRIIKSDEEIACLRKAADITVLAHMNAMRACSRLLYEYELEAEILHTFYQHGCRQTAYEPIVAGGKHACTLHYTANNQSLKKGELVLIDAGAEYQYYAADVTRTFPISGYFNGEQKALYTLVLAAQQAGIACIKPGTAYHHIQETVVRILTQGLCDLGLLKGSVDGLIEQGAYKTFYMHTAGHWLGLDVHDAGAYRIKNAWRPLTKGMVLTVEPGLYISPNDQISEKWWNMGIRIEDDILVTANSHDNLTAALPVKPDDIEALMHG